MPLLKPVLRTKLRSVDKIAWALPLVQHLVSEPSDGCKELEQLGTRIEWPGFFSCVLCFVLLGLAVHNGAASRGIVVAAGFLVF